MMELDVKMTKDKTLTQSSKFSTNLPMKPFEVGDKFISLRLRDMESLKK
jgi:hypothetical protein